jgi:hypothetical protein
MTSFYHQEVFHVPRDRVFQQIAELPKPSHQAAYVIKPVVSVRTMYSAWTHRRLAYGNDRSHSILLPGCVIRYDRKRWPSLSKVTRGETASDEEHLSVQASHHL